MKKRVLASLLAVVMLFGLVACSKPAASDPGSQEATEPTKAVIENQVAEKEISKAEEGQTLNYKKDIVIGHHQANVSVGPQEALTGMQKILAFMHFNRLTVFDPEAKEIVGQLAESFEPEENGKIWTFTLKKGVLFQNGEELKADDVVYTWVFIMALRNWMNVYVRCRWMIIMRCSIFAAAFVLLTSAKPS